MEIRISKRRIGPIRFPPGPPEPPGEVRVYHMSQEEIVARYGPPRKPLQERRSLYIVPKKKEVLKVDENSSALERARMLLPREKLVALKKAGKTDIEIMEEFEIVNTPYYALKKEYGLTTRIGSPKSDKGFSDRKMTIDQVLKLREETVTDIEGLTLLILTTDHERLEKLLTWYRDQYQHMLDRIDQAFSNTEVTI